MKVQDLLFWIVVGVLVGALIILVGNTMITSLVKVQVNVTTP